MLTGKPVMKTVKKGQILVCILASLLVYVLSGYGLYALTDSSWFALTKPVNNESFSAAFPEKIPLGDDESRPVSLPFWQVDDTSSLFTQVIVGTHSYRLPTKNTVSIWPSASGCPAENTGFNGLFRHLINCPNTAFKLTGGQPYYYLDIPPPLTST